MIKKSKTTLKIIAITLYAILVLPLLLGSLNVVVDSFVPYNLVEHHYMTQYRLIDSPQDMEENLSVKRYKHNTSGEILTHKKLHCLKKTHKQTIQCLMAGDMYALLTTLTIVSSVKTSTEPSKRT